MKKKKKKKFKEIYKTRFIDINNNKKFLSFAILIIQNNMKIHLSF